MSGSGDEAQPFSQGLSNNDDFQLWSHLSGAGGAYPRFTLWCNSVKPRLMLSRRKINVYLSYLSQSGVLGAVDLSLVSGKMEPEFIFLSQNEESQQEHSEVRQSPALIPSAFTQRSSSWDKGSRHLFLKCSAWTGNTQKTRKFSFFQQALGKS